MELWYGYYRRTEEEAKALAKAGKDVFSDDANPVLSKDTLPLNTLHLLDEYCSGWNRKRKEQIEVWQRQEQDAVMKVFVKFSELIHSPKYNTQRRAVLTALQVMQTLQPAIWAYLKGPETLNQFADKLARQEEAKRRELEEWIRKDEASAKAAALRKELKTMEDAREALDKATDLVNELVEEETTISGLPVDMGDVIPLSDLSEAVTSDAARGAEPGVSKILRWLFPGAKGEKGGAARLEDAAVAPLKSGGDVFLRAAAVAPLEHPVTEPGGDVFDAANASKVSAPTSQVADPRSNPFTQPPRTTETLDPALAEGMARPIDNTVPLAGEGATYRPPPKAGGFLMANGFGPLGKEDPSLKAAFKKAFFDSPAGQAAKEKDGNIKVVVLWDAGFLKQVAWDQHKSYLDTQNATGAKDGSKMVCDSTPDSCVEKTGSYWWPDKVGAGEAKAIEEFLDAKTTNAQDPEFAAWMAEKFIPGMAQDEDNKYLMEAFACEDLGANVKEIFGEENVQVDPVSFLDVLPIKAKKMFMTVIYLCGGGPIQERLSVHSGTFT